MNNKTFFIICMVLLPLYAKCAVAQEIAPAFTLTNIDGVEFSLSDYRKRVVLLDFFATWCTPCIAEIPILKSLHDEFGEDLTVISISVDPFSDTIEKLQQFRQDHEIDWIVARDTIGMTAEYNVQYVPTLVIIDQEGYIQYRHVGLTDESVLHQEISATVPEFLTLTPIMLAFLILMTVMITYKRKLLIRR